MCSGVTERNSACALNYANTGRGQSFGPMCWFKCIKGLSQISTYTVSYLITSHIQSWQTCKCDKMWMRLFESSPWPTWIWCLVRGSCILFCVRGCGVSNVLEHCMSLVHCNVFQLFAARLKYRSRLSCDRSLRWQGTARCVYVFRTFTHWVMKECERKRAPYIFIWRTHFFHYIKTTLSQNQNDLP